MPILQDKKILLTGLLSSRSIAYGIGKALKREGATLAFTYAGEAMKERVEKLAPELGGGLVMSMDVTRQDEIDGVFAKLGSEWGSLDGIAKVDPAIRPGVVSVPHGHRSANVNRLTDRARIDGPTGMVLYGGFAVEVGPAAPAHVATVRNGQPGLDGEAVHEHRGEPGRER